MPPSNNLRQTFIDGINDFNDAFNIGDYRNFKQYLHPTELILIQKVDDPGDFIVDYRTAIMTYLNADEVPEFPYFEVRDVQHVRQRRNRKRNFVGHVTGDGVYWDTYQDYTNRVDPIPVRYSLRFKNTDPDGGGIWLLVTANIAPI